MTFTTTVSNAPEPWAFNIMNPNGGPSLQRVEEESKQLIVETNSDTLMQFDHSTSEDDDDNFKMATSEGKRKSQNRRSEPASKSGKQAQSTRNSTKKSGPSWFRKIFKRFTRRRNNSAHQDPLLGEEDRAREDQLLQSTRPA